MHPSGRPAQRRSSRQWAPLLALLLVLTVVGHDLLMGANAHAADVGAQVERSNAGAHPLPRGFDPVEGKEPFDGDPSESGCDMRQTAVPASDAAGCDDLLPPAVAVHPFALDEGVADAMVVVPTLPPRVRRALLQVYRI